MTHPARGDILITDRTTSETDWKCGMKRWWYKEEGGTGIVPVKEEAWFEIGRQIHEDFAQLRMGSVGYEQMVRDILVGLGDTQDPIVLEPAYRRMGWIVAYGFYFRDRETEAGEDIAIESEIVLDRDPLWVVCTPDRLYRRYRDNRVIYRELKSCKYANYGWVNYWPRAVQVHIGLAAAREEYGVDIGHGEVMGLVKGEERDGRLMHPYVWAYWDDHDWIPIGQGSGRRGLTPRPVWEYNGGIIEWVKRLGPEVATAQFPFSAPIYLDERLLGDYIGARTFREKQVRLFRDRAQVDRELRARHFEPRYSECQPVIGAKCPYLDACHNAVVNRDPIGSGIYKPRTPHHEIEITGIE